MKVWLNGSLKKIFSTKKYFYFFFKKKSKIGKNRKKMETDEKKSQKIMEGVLLWTLWGALVFLPKTISIPIFFCAWPGLGDGDGKVGNVVETSPNARNSKVNLVPNNNLMIPTTIRC
jgi:hypothetical protein